MAEAAGLRGRGDGGGTVLRRRLLIQTLGRRRAMTLLTDTENEELDETPNTNAASASFTTQPTRMNTGIERGLLFYYKRGASGHFYMKIPENRRVALSRVGEGIDDAVVEFAR